LYKEPNLSTGIEVLEQYDFTPKDNSPTSICSAIVKFSDSYTEIHERRKISLQPLFYYDSYREDYEWDLFFFIANDEKIGKNSQFSILKYLYQSKQKGDCVSRDIFPFISWDSSPDSSRFSILWRLFNIEKNENETNGHILFIPF